MCHRVQIRALKTGQCRPIIAKFVEGEQKPLMTGKMKLQDSVETIFVEE